jgi:pseudomonalisin
VAKNASIKFVTSASTDTTDGIDLSAQYVVDNNVAPIVSTSYGLDEVFVGEAGLNFYNNLWAQAAAQGITSFVSSGDSGAGSNYTYDQAVNGLASTPYNVAVGGTQFEDAVGDWWSPTNNPDGSSALSYIPEAAWNDGDGWATGGGASLYFGQPSWQVAPGVPQNGQRNLPDVSLTASTHDGYLVALSGDLYVAGGTSASSPSFAGLLALAVQKTGRPQGNVNPVFYRLGNAQYTGTGSAIFHDITIGDNAIPGTPGWPATPGYDLTTGLGSVDAAALVGAFAPNPLKATYKVESDWGTGFEGQVYLTNTGSKAITGWTVELVFNGGFAIANAWNGDFNQQGSTVTIKPKSWNNILYPGQQAVFGYIGTYSGQKPQLVSLTLK